MSDEVAASSASRTAGMSEVSAYSSVVSQAEPIQTPTAPERERGGDLAAAADPARGEHRHLRADRVDDLGISTMLAISPVWPPAS